MTTVSETGVPVNVHTAAGLTCRGCGCTVDRLYQNDTCKPCLIKSFAKCISMIDYYRAGGRQSAVPGLN